MTGLRWAIAGGGTGGHVMPALALGERIRDAGEAVLFLGARRGLETRLVPEAGFELVALGAQPLVGRSPLERVRGALALAGAALGALRALRRFRPDGVISVGGYAAMPAVLAARLLRLPLVLVEPNALPGAAHRLAARFASRLCVAHPEAARALAGEGDARLRDTGVPLRRALVDALAQAPARRPQPPLHLFVFGGSQGARQLNDWMLAALPKLAPRGIEVVHQTGESDRERVAAAYAAAGLRAEVVAFERDMPRRYAWADLVVARAGAMSVAEIALAGRAAVFVPLVHTGGGEQLPNARALADAGAARVLDPRESDAGTLAETLDALLGDPERLHEMGRSAAARARPDAAERVLAACREVFSPDTAASEAGS